MPDIFRGLIIPFIGTTAGAAMVFLLRDQLTEKVQKSLTGFAAGVMVAASFWSLLAPALEEAENMGKFAFVPAAVGFLIGMGFLLLLDVITPHMHMDNEEEGPKSGLKRTTKSALFLRDGCTARAISRWHPHLHCPSASRFRTFPKARLYPCRFAPGV